MKKITALVCMLPLLTGCLGYSSTDNVSMSQVKKAISNTPIMLPDYKDVDISLGVMQGGSGSISSEDKWFYVPNEEDFKLLQSAAQTGKLVKITYDNARMRFYVESSTITHVELVK